VAYAKYSKTDAIQSLKRMYEKYQSVSSYLYVQEQMKPCYTVIWEMFGSWNNAVRAAGLPVGKEIKPSQTYSKEEIADILKQYIKCDSKLIFMTDYMKSGLFPTVHMIIGRFGSWRNAMLYLHIEMNQRGLLGQAKHRYVIAEEVVQKAIKIWDTQVTNGDQTENKLGNQVVNIRGGKING